MKQSEVWRRIKDYPDYEVSDKGRVRSHKHGWSRILRPGVSKDENRKVKLFNNGRFRHLIVHRLVLETFTGPCPLGYETNHKDGHRSNNNVENLEWVTRTKNALHAYRLGLRRSPAPVGERSSCSKLRNGEVWLIKKLLRKKIPQTEVAKMFVISSNNINCIALGYTWKHIN